MDQPTPAAGAQQPEPTACDLDSAAEGASQSASGLNDARRGGETLRERMEREQPEVMQIAREDLRRERYADAILAALARDTANGPNWGAAADAAQVVADEEQQTLLAILQAERGQADGIIRRLRAALDEMTRCRDNALRALYRDDVETDIDLEEEIAAPFYGPGWNWDEGALTPVVREAAAAVRPAFAKLTQERDRLRAELEQARGTEPAVGPTPCGPTPQECDGAEPCDRHEIEQAHADNEHELCDQTCKARSSDLYFCPTVAEVESRTHGGFDTCCAHPELHVDVPGIQAVSEYLSAQARGAAGQDTTTPADGEQETRQQIRIACAIVEHVPVTVLESHDYQEHAAAVLPVVRAAVAAGVRRALEDAANAIDAETRRCRDDGVLEPDKFRPCRDATEQLRARAAAVVSPAREQVPVCGDLQHRHTGPCEAYARKSGPARRQDGPA